MRTDLESAMTAVIGARSERRRFFDDPESFAESYSLDPAEIAALIQMGPDLGDLTGGFVRKREGYLRANCSLTLAMLGEEGNALLATFTDTHPMPSWHREESGIFGDYVIERTAEMRDGSVANEIIAEMARYEKYVHDSFWGATVLEGGDGGSQSEGTESGPEALRLRVGAVIAKFGWDVRLAARCGLDAAVGLQPDPCEVLFFYKRRFYDTRLTRLEARALRAMVPGEAVDIAVVRSALPSGTDLIRLLNRFFWQEAIEWV
jgi:hypothetical protein